MRSDDEAPSVSANSSSCRLLYPLVADIALHFYDLESKRLKLGNLSEFMADGCLLMFVQNLNLSKADVLQNCATCAWETLPQEKGQRNLSKFSARSVFGRML